MVLLFGILNSLKKYYDVNLIQKFKYKGGFKMIYATIEYKGQQKVCCVDRAGDRIFLTDTFFEDQGLPCPEDMTDFISAFKPEFTDDLAVFFGSRPELAICMDEVNLLAPIPAPKRNLVCLGKNYADHVHEIKGLTGGTGSIPKAPIYFTKATHTVIGPEATILRHEGITAKIDYEVELAIIIGKAGINIAPEDAEDYIFGYTVANDISARDLQTEHNQWFKGKSLISHCPMGPWILPKVLAPFPVKLDIKCYINGEIRQNSNTSNLIFDIPTIISDLSRGYQLLPGDIILTGTPAGVGMGFDPPKFLQPGDEVCCLIENIGALFNVVEDPEPPQ